MRAISFEMARLGKDEGSLGRLEALFHTVAGTAGTFGLAAVAALAREGEEICTAPIDAESLAYLGMILTELEHQTATLSTRHEAA